MIWWFTFIAFCDCALEILEKKNCDYYSIGRFCNFRILFEIKIRNNSQWNIRCLFLLRSEMQSQHSHPCVLRSHYQWFDAILMCLSPSNLILKGWAIYTTLSFQLFDFTLSKVQSLFKIGHAAESRRNVGRPGYVECHKLFFCGWCTHRPIETGLGLYQHSRRALIPKSPKNILIRKQMKFQIIVVALSLLNISCETLK